MFGSWKRTGQRSLSRMKRRSCSSRSMGSGRHGFEQSVQNVHPPPQPNDDSIPTTGKAGHRPAISEAWRR